jgi:hypothetical protein
MKSKRSCKFGIRISDFEKRKLVRAREYERALGKVGGRRMGASWDSKGWMVDTCLIIKIKLRNEKKYPWAKARYPSSIG